MDLVAQAPDQLLSDFRPAFFGVAIAVPESTFDICPFRQCESNGVGGVPAHDVSGRALCPVCNYYIIA